MPILPEMLERLRTESAESVEGYQVQVILDAVHLRDLISEIDARRSQAAKELIAVSNIAHGQNWAGNPEPSDGLIVPEVHRLRARFEELREGVDSAAVSGQLFIANNMCGREAMRDVVAHLTELLRT